MVVGRVPSLAPEINQSVFNTQRTSAETNWSLVRGRRADGRGGWTRRSGSHLPPRRVAASTPLIFSHATHLMLISSCMAGVPSLRPSWLELASTPFFFFSPVPPPPSKDSRGELLPKVADFTAPVCSLAGPYSH